MKLKAESGGLESGGLGQRISDLDGLKSESEGLSSGGLESRATDFGFGWREI